MKYKGHTIPDAEIDNMMNKLDISLEDACETILCDMGVEEDKTVEELTAKAQKNRVTSTIHQAKGTKKERKTKEKKENPLKKEIIQAIWNGIAEKYYNNGTIFIRNDEKYIDFTINGRDFTVNLVEHRQKKEE